jgi:hypothetical protein
MVIWTTGNPLAPDSAVSAQYWRVLITDNNGDASYVTMVDLELRASVGGADQTNATEIGLAYSASTEVNAGNRAGLAFDNDYTSTKWASNGQPTVGSPQWLKVNFDISAPFDTQVYVREISIVGCITGQTAMAPKDFALQRSDDDSSWTTVLTVTGQTGWTAGERRNFAV